MSDTNTLSEFRALFGIEESRSTSKEYYEWKIHKNPYEQGKILLEQRDGIVVGSITITPKKISIYGKEVIAAETGDAFTHPDYQRQGIFLKLLSDSVNLSISQGIELSYGVPNEASGAGSTKIGYPPCPFFKLGYFIKPRQVLLTIIISAVKLMLRKELEIPISFLFTVLKHNFVSSISSLFKTDSTKGSFDIFTVDKFTDEVDGLWGNPRYIFFTIRDKTYINWRYFENPDKYQVLVAKKGTEYLGYMVIKLPRYGNFGTICDFITIDDRSDVFIELIQKAEEIFNKAGVQAIRLRCANNSPYYRVLLDQGYYDRGPGFQKSVFVNPGTKYGKMLLETDAKWHFTLSDSDQI